MKQILVYADSLSWGIIPNSRNRLAFQQRWPGALELRLLKQNRSCRVIENCLNGRRTVWDDPYKPGRNGLQGLAQAIEMHSPLDLVIVMLGSNDFQSMHAFTTWHSAQGVAVLVNEIKNAPIEPGMPVPSILIIAPPPLQIAKANMVEKFKGGHLKCDGLAEAYRDVAEQHHCSFFDSAEVITCSDVDGVHLDAESHIHLADALLPVVTSMLD